MRTLLFLLALANVPVEPTPGQNQIHLAAAGAHAQVDQLRRQIVARRAPSDLELRQFSSAIENLIQTRISSLLDVSQREGEIESAAFVRGMHAIEHLSARTEDALDTRWDQTPLPESLRLLAELDHGITTLEK